MMPGYPGTFYHAAQHLPSPQTHPHQSLMLVLYRFNKRQNFSQQITPPRVF